MLQTREKACANLLHCLDNGIRPLRAWVRIPVILPGERTSTMVEPGRSVYASLQESDSVPSILDASLWVGYVWADEPRSSGCALVSGTRCRHRSARGRADRPALLECPNHVRFRGASGQRRLVHRPGVGLRW